MNFYFCPYVADNNEYDKDYKCEVTGKICLKCGCKLSLEECQCLIKEQYCDNKNTHNTLKH